MSNQMTKSPLQVSIETKLSLAENITFGLQHLLGLTGIWLFPGIIGTVLGLMPEVVGYIVQCCFITTGIVTILQSSRFLKLPVVQGPTAAFFVAIMSAGKTLGLGVAYGSLCVAGVIFMVLSLPFKKLGIMGRLVKYISPPIVFGSLLVIIGAQLAAYGLPGFFGHAGTAGYPGFNFAAAVVTLVAIILFMTLGGNGILRRGAILWGIIVGTLFCAAFGNFDTSPVAKASLLSLPQIFPWGFGVNAGIVLLMCVAFIHATGEAMGMYTLLTGWDGQKLTVDRVNRGIFTEVLGCTLGGILGGIATTSYPENIGIIRVSGIGSRFVTLTAGILALFLGFLPKIGVLIAIIPGAVLAGASALLFGVIAYSGIQMLAVVEWDELNMAVASTGFIIALGAMFMPAEILDMLPLSAKIFMSQPMLVGVVLLITLNIVINMWLRPLLAQKQVQRVEDMN
ncbi:uracil-xanthine permease family protein [Sporomusa acidovorans]|uniref:Nucleobase transporter PlUacP n=1 Tax=Sporomusa acidovorans (strain ATCC 49682 / DSM 3132 / Mol) TaxID=1123286 RepID=A0ABZ3J7S9_SPOA4|nr:solute carrier family 23 protein [Sporomusa acidovorans]OZC16719.1 uric acid permease PucK [Sporomusa acidovorans DSM 3132]SDE04885.1 uracil-xanthine permease [Sporomusa acidovorans]